MAIETNELIDVQTLSPFKKFIMTIGNIPTSYLESMTYAELLMWFCNYLQETVIPTVNNNAEAVEELQALYEELKEYVDNYFDNLDVQAEINNKLDKMAESGILSDMLNDYVVPYVDSLKNQPTLFIGDSYTNANPSYANYYQQYTGLPNGYFFKYALGGAGWVATGTGGKTYQDLLEDAIADMTTDEKTIIKKIIVGCGVNDANYSATRSQIKAAILDFMTLVSNNFPNATVYVINCGFRVGFSTGEVNARQLMWNVVIPSTLDCSNGYNNQLCVINNSHLWLRNSDWFQEDNLHPNQTGQQIIAKQLIRALHGDTNIRYTAENTTLTIIKDGNENETVTLNTDILNDVLVYRLTSNTRLYNITDLTHIQYNEIGTYSSKIVHNTSNAIGDIPVMCRCYINSSTDYYIPCTLRLGTNNKLYLFPYMSTDLSGIVNFTLYQFNYSQSLLLK